MTASMLDDPSA